MSLSITDQREASIDDLHGFLDDHQLYTLSESQVKGVITALSLAQGLEFASQLAAELHIKVDVTTFKVARHAAWFVGKEDALGSHDEFRADTFDGRGTDFLLYAMCAAVIVNYRCFPGLMTCSRGRSTMMRQSMKPSTSSSPFVI